LSFRRANVSTPFAPGGSDCWEPSRTKKAGMTRCMPISYPAGIKTRQVQSSSNKSERWQRQLRYRFRSDTEVRWCGLSLLDHRNWAIL
jgi:hypothetical protein